jgi:hypothetical protein
VTTKNEKRYSPPRRPLSTAEKRRKHGSALGRTPEGRHAVGSCRGIKCEHGVQGIDHDECELIVASKDATANATNFCIPFRDDEVACLSVPWSRQSCWRAMKLSWRSNGKNRQCTKRKFGNGDGAPDSKSGATGGDMAQIRKDFEEIRRRLIRLEQLLANLPEAIREKIGFKQQKNRKVSPDPVSDDHSRTSTVLAYVCLD